MRNVSGVLFLDKESGVSSACLLRQVKNLFQAKKVGHTGTLDPLATGMLPVCFGKATKFSQYLLCADKSYRVVAKFGERTDTFDALGKVISVRPVRLHEISVHQALSFFIGKSYQTPPMFSALKHYGRPLYQYARQGINIIKNARLINIYNINLMKWDDKYIELEIFCSKGTYIRSFIDDLGEYLGCGAHVVSLRRFSFAHFSSELMINIAVLQQYNIVNDVGNFSKLDSFLYPVDIMVHHLPEINVSEVLYRLLRFGQKVKLNHEIVVSCDMVNTAKLVRMSVGLKKKFFGVGSIVDNKYLLVRCLFIS